MAWYYIQEILGKFATNFLKVAKLVYQDIESVSAWLIFLVVAMNIRILKLNVFFWKSIRTLQIDPQHEKWLYRNLYPWQRHYNLWETREEDVLCHCVYEMQDLR